MIVDFNVSLIAFDGKVVKKTKTTVTEKGLVTKELEGDAMLGDVVIDAMSATYRSDENIDPVEKMKRFTLSMEIAKGKPVELTIEEAALIKSLVLKGCSILACGRICALLEVTAEQPKVSVAPKEPEEPQLE